VLKFVCTKVLDTSAVLTYRDVILKLVNIMKDYFILFYFILFYFILFYLATKGYQNM